MKNVIEQSHCNSATPLASCKTNIQNNKQVRKLVISDDPQFKDLGSSKSGQKYYQKYLQVNDLRKVLKGDFDTKEYDIVYIIPKIHGKNCLANCENTKKAINKLKFVFCDQKEAIQYLSWIKKNKKGSKTAKNTATEILNYCLHSFGRVNSFSDDNFSIEVANCSRLSFNQYINESEPTEANEYGIIPLDFILFQIEYRPKLILEGLAGVGKTALLLKLIHQGQFSDESNRIACDLEYLNSIGIQKVIVLIPKTSINSQLYEDAINKGLVVGHVDGTVKGDDLKHAQSCNVVFCTHNSIDKLSFDLDTTMIVIDEYHELVSEWYRVENDSKQSFRVIFNNLIGKVKNTLLLSATPNYLFTQSTSVCEYLGYHLIKGRAKTTNTIDLTAKIYDGKTKDIPRYVYENRPSNDLILMKLDNTNELDLNASLFKGFGFELGKEFDFFTSKTKDRKENNLNYQKCMKLGFLPKELIILMYTCLMESGVSVKNKVSVNAIIDTIDYSKIIQLYSRPRYNHKTSVNKVVNTWVFMSKDRFEETNNNELLTDRSKAPKAVEMFKAIAAEAKEFCKFKNGTSTALELDSEVSIKTNNLWTDGIEKAVFRVSGGMYQVCYLGVMNLIYRKSLTAPLDLIIKRIQRFDERVRFLGCDTIKADLNQGLEDIKASKKEIKEELKIKLLSVFKAQFDEIANVMRYKDKNLDFKEDVNLYLNVPNMLSDGIIDYYTENKDILSGGTAKRLIRNVIELCKWSDTKKFKDIAINLCTEFDPPKVESYINTLKVAKRRNLSQYKGALSKVDMKEHKINTNIVAAVKRIRENIKNGNRIEWLSSKQVVSLINKARAKASKDIGLKKRIDKDLTAKDAIPKLKEIFKLEKAKFGSKGNQVIKYKIIGKVSTDVDTYFEMQKANLTA